MDMIIRVIKIILLLLGCGFDIIVIVFLCVEFGINCMIFNLFYLFFFCYCLKELM